MEHLYITDCNALGEVEIFYLLFSFAYAVILFIWHRLVWKMYPDPLSSSLQRGIIALPALKLLQVAFYGLQLRGCPWPNLLQSRYYLMALLTVSTVYYTVLIAYLLVLSKGWKIARMQLDRRDVSRNTLILAAVYLIFSAYYVSVNVPQMKNFVEVTLISLTLTVRAEHALHWSLRIRVQSDI